MEPKVVTFNESSSSMEQEYMGQSEVDMTVSPWTCSSFRKKSRHAVNSYANLDVKKQEDAKLETPHEGQKCKACARYWCLNDKVYKFQEISDELVGILAPISFRSEQPAAREDQNLCKLCYEREPRCEHCKKYKNASLNESKNKGEAFTTNAQSCCEDNKTADQIPSTSTDNQPKERRLTYSEYRESNLCKGCAKKLRASSEDLNSETDARTEEDDKTICQRCWARCGYSGCCNEEQRGCYDETDLRRYNPNSETDVRTEEDDKTICQRCWASFWYSGCCNEKQKGCYDETGPRRYNPIWTGKDDSQIGVFIRNLRIVGLDEEKKTITLQFFLNVCWLHKELCDWYKTHKNPGDEWHAKLSPKEYENYFKDAQKDFKDANLEWNDYHSNLFPEVKIWNVVAQGLEERQDVISLNKKWIGPNTVYWRRLVNVKLNNSFCSSTYPFGYEKFRLTIRLISYTKQSLALMRTNLWYEEQTKQVGKSLAARSFSYIVPDKTFMIDWKVCSVHGYKDRWYSKFDHNDLTYRLPVTVSRGQDTTSRFEAWVILKRRPRSVLFVYWVWYTMTSTIALLTWKLDPIGDLADRLAIAVGIIFIQMGLKIHSAAKIPRMPNITVMDAHSFVAVAMVFCEAISQVLLVQFLEGDVDNNEDESNRLLFWDVIFAWINTGLVVFVNIVTFSFAKCKQHRQKRMLEKGLRTFTGFDKEPLTIAGKPLGDCVFEVKGHNKHQPIKVTEQDLQKRIDKFSYKKQQSKVTRSVMSKCLSCLSCSLCREIYLD